MHHALGMIRDTNEYRELQQLLARGHSQVMVSGLAGAQKAVFTALFLEELSVHQELEDPDTHRPFLLLSATEEGAARFYEELVQLLPHRRLAHFPALEDLTFQALGQSKELVGERVSVLRRLLQGELHGVVASPAALLSLLLPPAYMDTLPLALSLGALLPLTETLRQLVKLGYKRTQMVETPGYFALRGGILDIFPPSDTNPLRIELFGDVIDSIRRFSPESQLSLTSLREAAIPPAREVVLDESAIPEGRLKIQQELTATLATLTTDEAKTRLSTRVNHLLQLLASGESDDSIDYYLPYFISKPASLLDYFTSPPLLLIDEPVRLQEVWEERWEEIAKALAERLAGGELLPKQKERYYPFASFQQQIQGSQVVAVTLLPRRPNWLRTLQHASAINRTLPPFHGAVQSLMDEVERWKEHGF
ncbi:MAG: hypothetical protein FWF06_05245, partial [Symbiobacteriaceae bacterium]|nr:hypothetical protein [Symbiobacteriaceae bacterium]